jgi:hypothetical protein
MKKSSSLRVPRTLFLVVLFGLLGLGHHLNAAGTGTQKGTGTWNEEIWVDSSEQNATGVIQKKYLTRLHIQFAIKAGDATTLQEAIDQASQTGRDTIQAQIKKLAQGTGKDADALGDIGTRYQSSAKIGEWKLRVYQDKQLSLKDPVWYVELTLAGQFASDTESKAAIKYLASRNQTQTGDKAGFDALSAAFKNDSTAVLVLSRN